MNEIADVVVQYPRDDSAGYLDRHERFPFPPWTLRGPLSWPTRSGRKGCQGQNCESLRCAGGMLMATFGPFGSIPMHENAR